MDAHVMTGRGLLSRLERRLLERRRRTPPTSPGSPLPTRNFHALRTPNTGVYRSGHRVSHGMPRMHGNQHSASGHCARAIENSLLEIAAAADKIQFLPATTLYESAVSMSSLRPKESYRGTLLRAQWLLLRE